MAEKQLYDSNSTMYVLGALLRQPSLIHESKYILTDNDFDGLHKIIFGVIYNLSVEGATSIRPADVDIYLKQYTKQYETYKKKRGYDYLKNLYELVDYTFDTKQFEYYYERVKKFTILRDFNRNGIDITPFYNPDADFTEIDKENQKLNDYEVQDLFNKIREKVAIIEDQNISKTNIKAIDVSFGLGELVNELKQHPEVGYPLDGEYLNFAARGARLGKLYLYSAPTGHGKTRFFVGNACALSMPYIQDGKIIKKKDLTPVLFIATEMDPDEIQTMVLSYVSGVDEDRLLTNTLTSEDQRLIDVALKIIEEYKDNFKIEKISDPSISTLRSKITKYILNEHYYHIFYDYIFTSPALNSEFQKTGLRDDVVLMMLSNTLKEIASDYNVFVYTGTQVSRGWEKTKFRNENYLAGSKAIGDKADFGTIAIKVDSDEHEIVAPLLSEMGIKEKPNVVLDVYKNRRGRIVNAKIYRVFDYGTCRAKDLLITDTNHHKWNLGIGRAKYQYDTQDLLDVMVEHSGGKDDE